MRLIVRIETKPKALWQYMGQYEILLSDPLSLAEWTVQSEQVLPVILSFCTMRSC